MNELKEELDIIFNLTQTAYIKDGKIVPFVAPISYEKELKRKIMQLIETYTAKKELEARIDELEHVDGYECYWTQIKDTPDMKTDIDIDERITQLSSQLNKEGIEK